MMKKNFWHIVAFALLMPAFASAQAIVKGAGIVYTNGAPTHSVSQNTDAETAIDSTSGYWYEFNRDGLGWILAGFRVQEFPFSVAPTAAPGDKQSELLLNNVDSLYRWNGTAWKHLNKAGDPSSTNEGILGVGAGASNTSILLSNTTGATGVTIQASTGLSINETPSSNGGTIVLTNTAPDQTVSLTGAGITVITGTYPSFTITSTEVDGSITNELQTLANTSNATSHTTTLSNSGGSTQFVEGTGIGLATTGTSLNGVVTITNSSPDQTVSITGAGISVVTGTYPTFTITSTEVDGSITNEGVLGVGAGGASSSVLLSNTSTAAGVTINVAGILAISETTSANGGQITLTATEVDGSVTNELQTIANTSNATSHTATLSNSGGSIQLVEGSGITLTTTGTTLDGIVTIAATASATDLTFTGTGPYTLNSSTGTDVTITQGSGIVITRTSNDLSFAASDASATNELQTLASTSDATSHTVTLSNSGGSFKLVEGSNITLTTTGTGLDGIITIASTAGSGNYQLLRDDGVDKTGRAAANFIDAAIVTFTLTDDGAGGETEIVAGIAANSIGSGEIGANAIGNSEMADNAIGSAEVIDNSLTAADLLVNVVSSVDGVTNDGGDIDFIQGGIVTITPNDAANTITISATEVDGSVTNELQTLANTSNATSHTTTLSNSGGSTQFVEGTGIGLATTGTTLDGVLTITNTAPDQTVSITGAGISVVTGTYPTFTITSTEVDGSVTNEAWTIDGDDAETEVISNQTVKFQGAGIAATDYDAATNVLLITATEVDGSVTNEGVLGVGAGGASSSVLLSNTSGATGVTINVAGINAITESTSSNGGSITITATEVDGSVTNELQTLANTSNATSHTATLSNSGGSMQLVEGSGITLTTTGTTLDGIVTIAATTQATDLTFTGSGPYTLNSSTGTDVTITQGSGIVITRTSNDLSFAASDASATNELQTLANTSTGTTHTATLSNSGGSLQLAEGANVTLTTTGTTLDGIVTVAAAGTDLQFTGISPTFDLTSSTGTDVQFEAGTNITITRTGGTKLTIASSTAADGNGYYSGNGGNGGNGTIPSLTTSTITNQFTFSRATDDVGGLVPVRISVAAGNEPDFMSFVNGSDSILISKGDQEFEIDANKTLVVRSTELLYLIADSINISTVPTGFDNEATLLFVSPAGTIVKAEGLDPDIIRQNGAATNDVLKWNGSKWAPAAGGGGGTPAGSSFEVQYNNAGAFGSETVFQYDPTDNELVVGTTTANAAIHGRARNDTGASIFLAENNSANDVLKVNSDGYTQFGDNASLPRIYQTASAGAAVSYTAQGLTFEGIPTATTGLDLFSFLEATAAPTAGDFNVVRQTGTFNPTSGSASIDGFVTDPTINIATSASGLARGFVATPTLTSALGGYHAFATNINSGTNRWAFYGAGTADSRINGRLGIGGDPVSGFNLYSNAAIRIDGAVVSRGTGTNPASDLVTPQMRLWNTTATTGDIWYFASLNNGDFVVRSDNAGANQLVIKDAASGGQVQVTNTLRIGTFTGTPTQLNGTDGSGNVGVVNLGSGVTLQGIGELPLWNSNDAGSVTSLTATALADVTGLSFAVTANVKYEFWAAIKYSANNTTTGSAWSIDCPAGTVALQVESATANNAKFFHAQNAENTLLASASSAYTSGNLAYVRGIVEPTSGGTCILRGATEVASNAITVQGTSNVNWREIK